MLSVKAAVFDASQLACPLPYRRPQHLKRLGGVRWLAVVLNAPISSKTKVWKSIDDAVKDVKSGDNLLSGGKSAFIEFFSGEHAC